MKTYIATLGLLLLSFCYSNNTWAQQGSEAKINAAKVSYISDRLNLSSQQAAQFWPIFNAYQAELNVVYRAKSDLKNQRGMTAEELIDERQKLDERMLAIKNKYKKQFLTVLSASQLNNFYQAEADFKLLLLNMRNK